MFPATSSILVKRLRCLRLAPACIAIAFCGCPAWGGEIVFTSTTEQVLTPAPNNDDYTGEFDENPNRVVFDSGHISSLEGVFAVRDSGGTSEYALTIGGSYNYSVDPLLSSGYQLEVGFGAGENFVPVSRVLSGLDFDAPLPSDPAIPTSISYFDVFPLFDLVSHESDTIRWSGHDLNGEFWMSKLFQIPLDVPDLSVALLDFYDVDDLPPDFPVGAAAFTVRGRFISEPIACDYNDNRQVDQGDLDLVLLNWERAWPPGVPGWHNDRPTDGWINQNDLDGVLQNWGNSAATASVVAVPEPTTWLLLVASICTWLRRRRAVS